MDSVSVEPQVHCALLPCSSGETWVVPVNSIAEVVVAAELLAGRLCWRGLELPVFPPVAATQERTGGMYAVMLGLRDLPGDYWAICLRNRPLGHRRVIEADLTGHEDAAVTADTLAVFALAGSNCVLPDLEALQLSLAAAPADS